MSAAYWVDLREGVIRSWENGRRQGGIAREFGISLGSINRLLFQDVVSSLAAHRVIVIDESGTHISMTPTYARAPRGQRAYDTTIRNYGHKSVLSFAIPWMPYILLHLFNTLTQQIWQ